MERFWKRVDLFFGITDEDCWNWTGYRQNNRYGIFQLRPKTVPIGAHHVLMKDKPPGMWVLHKCDNPACVNPSHLYFGTAKDNHEDQRVRGRFPRTRNWKNKLVGEKSPTSKLTEAQVADIRLTPKKRGFYMQLAHKYGVCKETIMLIYNGKSWKHSLPAKPN